MLPSSSRRLDLFLGPILVLPWVGCDDSRGPRAIERTRDDPQAQTVLGMDPAERFGLEPTSPLFLYEVPEGFEELPPRPLRDVNLRFGDAECYVSLLSPGGTLENVNRWRGQMGLAPIDAAELARLPTVRLLGRDAPLVDLEGDYHGMGTHLDGARLLGAYVSFPAFGVSVKLVGPADTVAEARPAFERFLRSLRINPERMGGGGAASGARPGSRETSPPLRWVVPEGWEEAAGSSMRLVTFRSSENPRVECWMTLLPGSAGGVAANVNRWRREVGAPPLSEQEVAALPRIDVGGRSGVVVDVEGDYRGMGGAAIEGARLLGAIVPLERGTLFVKMVGPAEDVAAESERFRALCASVEWAR